MLTFGERLRVLIYTGKGGVGKTSVSAATALRCAKLGHRTIVISTDSAHSLADSLDMPLTGDIKNILPNLDAIEVDVIHEMETRWKEIGQYLSDFMESQGMDPISAKEMTVWPGMELMSALFYIEEFKISGKYDVVVMDTAPTAETLRLLSFPDTADWYFDKMYKMFKNTVKLARATVGKIMSTPMPSNAFLEDLDHIRDRMKEVRIILQDSRMTSVRLVVNPEKMVINETKRAYTYLSLYNLTVECLVINRLLPEGMRDHYPQAKYEEQSHYMELIEESFSPLKMLKAYQSTTEVVGQRSLEVLAEQLFGDIDPAIVFTTEKAMEIFSKNGVDMMALKLPFSSKDEVELYKTNDVLIVKVGWYKRSVALPYSLVHKEAHKAEFKDGRLLISFK
ncbi:MAG TPA: ArsA family ATPase [Methanomassiliicoccales archaeon]|nr:ArsA family ATPase [Methanomassiliicoccales archaeon]